jgi:hypothetical protein
MDGIKVKYGIVTKLMEYGRPLWNMSNQYVTIIEFG